MKDEVKNIYDALAESILAMSDEEVKEEVCFLGEDFEQSVSEIKKSVRDTVDRYKKNAG